MSESIRMTPLPDEIMKTYSWLDEYLRVQTATEKEFQPAWQAYKYLLKGKMYAYIGIHEPTGRPIITLKLEPAYSDMLRREYEDVIEGYYMNKLHWSSMFLDGEVPIDVIKNMVSASYAAMFASLSKKVQQEISGQ